MVWLQIKQEFFKNGYKGLTEDILDRKFRNLKKTYKTIKDNNKKTSTGRGRVTWEYFEDFENIFVDDRTINYGPVLASLPEHKGTSSIPQTAVDSDGMPEIACDSLSTSVPSSAECSMTTVTSALPSCAGPSTPIAGSSTPIATTKREKGKKLQAYRKKKTDIEERRVEELKKIREAIEKSNIIQQERNKLLSEMLNKK